MNSTNTLKQWTTITPFRSKVRQVARDLTIRGLAIGRRINKTTNWIRFIYYHHVFDDECRGFSNQLKYLGQLGEFISIDDAVSMLEKATPIDGRYFCVTFDDGLKSCRTRAAPILAEHDIPAAFYIVTSLVGRSLVPEDYIARIVFGFQGKDTTLDFMTWDDCLYLIEHGMTIASHSETHTRLANITEEEIKRELGNSKLEVEKRIGGACLHFCAPYGIPGRDYDIAKVSKVAKQTGYKSLVTGQRGPTMSGDDPFAIRRDHLIAKWGEHQLRYFLSLGY